MTFSDCWIKTLDDPGFISPISLPPTPQPGHYWKSEVCGWARANNLAIEDVDELQIRVAVSRAQLLQFLDEMFWREEEALARREREKRNDLGGVQTVESLRIHCRRYLRTDKTYFLVADEF